MTRVVEEVSFDELSDAELSPILELTNAVQAEESPRHVDLTLDEFRMFSANPGYVQRRFRVLGSVGEVVGFSVTRYQDDGSVPHLLQCQIRVAKQARRRGVGTLLLSNAVERARELGRDTIQLYHYDTVPAAEEFLTAIGAKPVLEMHVNVLPLVRHDQSLMEQWVRDGHQQGKGYRVDIHEGDWPEEILGDMARLYYILDRDSPQAEGHEPRKWTADLIRQFLDVFLAGTDSLMALAIDESTNRAVGMSQLIRRHANPATWIVTTTMVEPEHRGRALGRWLKGAVNLAALDRWKGGTHQETANAYVNAPMLAINREMGFEPEHTFIESEVSVETAQRFVDSKTG